MLGTEHGPLRVLTSHGPGAVGCPALLELLSDSDAASHTLRQPWMDAVGILCRQHVGATGAEQM